MEWAHAHPALPGDESWRVSRPTAYGEEPEFATPEEHEFYGIPEVHWAAPAAFAAANGMSTTAGKALIRDALVLRHRLPRTWTRRSCAAPPAWRARRIARAALGAPADVVAHLDDALAGIAHRVGPIQLDRLLDKAMLELHAEERELARAEALDRRYARLEEQTNSTAGMAEGLAEVVVRGDWKDLHDFDRTLSEVAAVLAATPEGRHETLDTRRSMAVGVLADPERALALLRGAETPASRPQVVLYLHLAEAALVGSVAVGRNETSGRPVLEQQIREWCGRSDHHLTVKPVVDLDTPQSVDAYEVPGRLRERTVLRHPTCVFPFCARRSRRLDVDHRVAYAAGGPTSDENLAPLCRHHHRLKTHAGWRYTQVEPGVYLWSDPHHQRFLRDRAGTTDLTASGEPDEG